MADVSVNKFEMTVLSALHQAQDELISAGLESSHTNEAFRELKMYSVSKRHFGGIRQPDKHVLLAAFPMLTNISKRWLKTFMRQMIPRCGVKNPWRVIVSQNISRDLFGMVQQIGTRSSYKNLMFPVPMWDLTAGLAGGWVLDPLDSWDHGKPWLMDVH